MFEGFSPRTIDFMWNLRLNNNKPWFTEHKEEFQREFLAPMKALNEEVFKRISDTCGNRGFTSKISRIYKDARRLRGGDPYRDHLWFTFEKLAEERTSIPVFWFELGPDDWSYGLGYYQARPGTMARLRARIDKDPKKFEKLVAPLSQQDEFVLEGPEYVRKKEAPSAKTAEWYNRKSFSLTHRQENGKILFSKELADRLVSGMAFLMPLYDYFVTLDNDPDPSILANK